MKKIFAGVATAGLLLAACGEDDAVDSAGDTRNEGPIISSSETPRNEAIDTTPTDLGDAQTPGANSFTEGQARGAIESAGYTNVGALTQTEDGLWQGSARRNGEVVNVSIDYRGEVTEQAAAPGQ